MEVQSWIEDLEIHVEVFPAVVNLNFFNWIHFDWTEISCIWIRIIYETLILITILQHLIIHELQSINHWLLLRF